MGYQAKKTEHTGAKHGSGAYWGPKKDAKKESGKIRRRNEKQALREQVAEGAHRRAECDRLLAEEAIEEGLADLEAGRVSPSFSNVKEFKKYIKAKR
jgi:hypothetical protein